MIVHPNGLENGALLPPRGHHKLEVLSEFRQERRMDDRSVGRCEIQFKNENAL